MVLPGELVHIHSMGHYMDWFVYVDADEKASLDELTRGGKALSVDERGRALLEKLHPRAIIGPASYCEYQ